MELLPAACTALRRMMKRWIEHMQPHIYMSMDPLARASTITDDLWIHWDLASSSSTLSSTDVQAMELLELYAQVDYRGAWTAIFSATNSSMYLEELMDAVTVTGTKLYPRFAITGLDEPLMRGHFKATFKKLVLRNEPMHQCDSYYQDRETLLQYWADDHDGAPFQRFPDNPIQIKLYVTLTSFEDNYRDRKDVHSSMRGLEYSEVGGKLLSEVAAIAALSQDRENLRQFPEWHMRTKTDRLLPVSDVFKLESVNLKFDHVYVTDEVLQTTQELFERTHVHGLRFCMATYKRDELSRQVTTRFFQKFLLGEALSTQRLALQLFCEVRFPVFQAVCSALMASASVGSVCILFPEKDSAVDAEEEEEEEEDEDDLEWELKPLDDQYPDVEEEEEEVEDGDEDQERDIYEPHDDFELTIHGEDYRLFWAWIAYAIFSGEATHRINHLELRAFALSQEHIRSFERVLKAQDPLAFIASSHDGPYKLPIATKAQREPAVVDLKPHSMVFLEEDRGYAIQTGDRIETLRVVDDSHRFEKVCVLYPGAGVCWVARSNILERRTVVLPNKPAYPLRSLTIQVDNRTSATALMRFIQLTGASLHSLTISALFLYPPLYTGFPRILTACPELRHLTIQSIAVSDLEWVWTRGFHLESLSLSDIVAGEPDSYQRFFAGLASTPTRLKDLDIQWEPEDLDALMPGLLTMLDTIRSIERLFLSVKHVDEKHIKALKERHGVPLSVRRSPLPLRCKLAFLSVLSNGVRDESNKHPQSTALPELDTSMVATIVAFAAPNKYRVCGFLK